MLRSYKGLPPSDLIIRPLTLKDHFQSIVLIFFHQPKTLYAVRNFYFSYHRVNHLNILYQIYQKLSTIFSKNTNIKLLTISIVHEYRDKFDFLF